jgi:hypothetical protein
MVGRKVNRPVVAASHERSGNVQGRIVVDDVAATQQIFDVQLTNRIAG